MTPRPSISQRAAFHSRRLFETFSAAVAASRARANQSFDRRAHPLRPSAVVVLDHHAPAVLAGSGRHLFAAGRKRYATASDVLWLSPSRLVVVYLLTNTVTVFDFDDSSGTPVVTLRGEVTHPQGIEWPSAIAAPPDRRWLAVTKSAGGAVTVFSVDESDESMSATVLATVSFQDDRSVHGLAVSPDGRFIAHTSIDEPGGIRITHVPSSNTWPTPEPMSAMTNTNSPLKPKGIRFTPDGRFVVVAYGSNVTRSRAQFAPGFVEVRRFDTQSGAIGEVTSRTPESFRLGAGESIAMLPDGTRLVVTDQVRNTAQMLEFDRETGQLGEVVMHIGAGAGGLSFPHGCAVSPDQRWIAITNYGDGSIRFFPTTPSASM